jgi:uncharacterized Fe-S cluster-containing radical SAM superfamily protein
MTTLFDFLERSSKRDSEVGRDEGKGIFSRKYTSVTFDRFYGGSITCRSLGCNLDCAYCFNSTKNKNPENFGKFFTSVGMFEKILAQYNKHSSTSSSTSSSSTSSTSSSSASSNPIVIRMTGTEAIMGQNTFNHLNKLIELVLSNIDNCIFIIETNGIMLGINPYLISQLYKSNRLYIRICFKGKDPDTFSKTTGTFKEYYEYQHTAVEEIEKRGINCMLAIADIYGDIENICEMYPTKSIEKEKIICYNKTIKERMKKLNSQLKS